MDIQTLISFLCATAIIVVIPGPNIMLITHDSIRYGFRKSVITVTGISAGMILLFSLSLSGITTLFIQFPWLFDTIKITGVLYLLFLGLTQIYDSLKIRVDPHQVLPSKDNFFIKGFLISISNPKGLFFAGAFFPQFLNKNTPVLPQVLLLCGGCLLVASVIGVMYAFFAKTAEHFFNSGTFQKRASLFSGFILILFGVGLYFANSQEFI